MSREPLWRLPEEALLFDEDTGRWKVMAVRGLGECRALFIPVAKKADQWQLAVDAQSRLPLTPVPSGKWSALPRVGGAPGCRYLCAIVYDIPSNHPDDTFLHGLPPGNPLPTDLSGEELERVFTKLARRYPERIDADVVDGPPDPITIEPIAYQGAVQAMAAARGVPAFAAAAIPVRAAQARAHEAPPPDQLTFAFGSCQYPAGMLDRHVAHASYRALAEYLKKPGVRLPERLLLLGDQVYVDATYGLLDPARLDDRYRMPYEDMRDRDTGPFSPVPQQFLARAMRMTPDDHEFLDNWEPSGRRSHSARFKMGIRAFWDQQRRRTRRNTRGVQLHEERPGWRLFMTDTRTQRGYRSASTLDKALIMSSTQTASLERWLAEPGAEADLKIVTSAAMLLPRGREYVDDPLYLDNWQGYPASFHRLLAFLCENQLRNVVFLSGDAHLACSAHVQVANAGSGKSVEFVSHHAPALYGPYPFANESRYNLLLQDRFAFTAEVAGRQQSYECTVHTELLDEGHDGVGLMTATRAGDAWSTKVDVLRA
jgi:hypothetical protein